MIDYPQLKSSMNWKGIQPKKFNLRTKAHFPMDSSFHGYLLPTTQIPFPRGKKKFLPELRGTDQQFKPIVKIKFDPFPGRREIYCRKHLQCSLSPGQQRTQSKHFNIINTAKEHQFRGKKVINNPPNDNEYVIQNLMSRKKKITSYHPFQGRAGITYLFQKENGWKNIIG